MIRLRTNLAWALRGLAKRINAIAERLEPIKLSTAAVRPSQYIAGLPVYETGKPITRLSEPSPARTDSSLIARAPSGTDARDRRRFSSTSRGKR